MAAYMNSSLSDALTMRCLLWSTVSEVIRQMSVRTEEIVSWFDIFNTLQQKVLGSRFGLRATRSQRHN